MLKGHLNKESNLIKKESWFLHEKNFTSIFIYSFKSWNFVTNMYKYTIYSCPKGSIGAIEASSEKWLRIDESEA